MKIKKNVQYAFDDVRNTNENQNAFCLFALVIYFPAV